MLFGLMTSMLGFVINDQVAPFCRERVEHQLRASRQSLVTFQLLLGRTMAEFPGFKLWAGSCRDRILDDVEIYRTTGSTGGDLIMARQGEVLRESSDERLRIELLDGNILTWPEEGRGNPSAPSPSPGTDWRFPSPAGRRERPPSACRR